MRHPVGQWRSANHDDVVLRNWARLKGINIGKKGHCGYALFVESVDTLKTFVVEGRGHGYHRLRCEYSYLDCEKGQFSRGAVFKKALDLYQRLTA